MTEVTLQQLFEAGVHFGHQTRNWKPKMAPYIFGIRNKIHIINLDKTLPLFKKAVEFLASVAAKKGKILFVGTKTAAREIIREEAVRCGMPYVDYRWLGGMLTNYKTIRQSIKRLIELEEMRDSPVFEQITKKEALILTREIAKLEQALGGIRNMGGLPDAIFVIDVGHEKIAVTEARKLRIPVVGIVDTNNDPKGIDYMVPGNDDSARAIKLYVQNVADAIADARKNFAAEIAIEEKEKESKKSMKKTAKPSKKKVVTKKVTIASKDDAKEAIAAAHIAEKEEAPKVKKHPAAKKTHKAGAKAKSSKA